MGTYLTIGIFHRSCSNLSIEQLQNDIPVFFNLLRKQKKRRWPRGICAYCAIPIYSTDHIEDNILEWSQNRPKHRYAMWYEPIFYNLRENNAEVFLRDNILRSPFKAFFIEVITAALESLAKSNGHEKGPSINEQSKPPTIPGIYRFVCSYDGIGSIFSSDGSPLWNVKGQNEKRPHFPYGLFRLPDFVVSDLSGQEVYRIQRVQRLPRAKFVMTQNGRTICTIRQRSFLLNKYTLDFESGEQWTFRMPLFSICFRGKNKNGDEIFVRLLQHVDWAVSIKPGCDSPALLAALSFIHRERLRCN